MKVNAKSYPHPVLGNEDDIGGSFGVDFRYELSRTEVVFNPTFNLQNQNLEDLIKKGGASFIVEVECPSTFFRTFFSTGKQIEKFVLPAKLLRERVSAGFYICADKELRGYKPSECHPDYAGASFDIEKGDVLAVGGYCAFIAEKSFDPLRPPVSSFMSIVEGLRHEGPIEIDYTSDKIMIELSKADYRNYMDFKGQKVTHGTIHASVVLPVLVDAIYKVENNNRDYEDRNWYARLEAILDNKGLRGKEPFESAQRILENPSSRNFQSINSMLDNNSDQEND